MIINRICNLFNFLDSGYSDLYEKQLNFEKEPCKRTQQELIESSKIFKSKLTQYQSAIKDAYFRN